MIPCTGRGDCIVRALVHGSDNVTTYAPLKQNLTVRPTTAALPVRVVLPGVAYRRAHFLAREVMNGYYLELLSVPFSPGFCQFFDFRQINYFKNIAWLAAI